MYFQTSLFNDFPLTHFPSTRYQGSKLKFVDWIWECIKHIQFDTVLDAFGGTGSVGYRLKQENKSVHYNDILSFNYFIGKALIENAFEKLSVSEVDNIISECPDIIYPNFIETTFKDIYFTDEENRWLDIVSTNIRHIKNEYKQAIAYFALFQSCLIKRPYNLFHRKNLYVRTKEIERSFGNKKTWDTPFDVHFRKFVQEADNAVFNNGKECLSLNKDVFNISTAYDLVYIDTPYLNDAGRGVDYADFYHFLNGIVHYDEWDKMIDYNSNHFRLKRQSNIWNNANSIKSAFEHLFSLFNNSVLVISYRSNGIPAIEELSGILKRMGRKVNIYQSPDIKYVLSKKLTNEILIVAQ